MSIPLVQEATKDAINTSIIAIKRNIERINMLLGLVDSGSPDLSGLATKQELEDAITQIETDLAPVDEVTLDNMQSVTSNAVSKAMSYLTTEQKTGGVWIDGKPIYRRVFTGTASNTNQAQNIATISNVSSVISIRNLQKASNAGWYEDWGFARTNTEELESSAYFDFATGKLYQSHKSSIFNSQPYTIIFEYTKTTD